MARKPRVHLPGGYYHVMMRGNGGDDIFFSSADHTRFLLLIQEGIERYDHRIHAFCLMNNHVHLLVQVGSTSLSSIIQNLSFRYTRYINRQRQRVGHLFQGRYQAILVDADSYLLELVRYIHLNPVRAGLCEWAEPFEWSSFSAYMGIITIPWLHTEEVLACFAADESRARALFADFVAQGAGEKWRKDFHHGSHRGQILGDDHFADQVLQRSDSGMGKPLSLVEVLDAVAEVYEVAVATLYEPSKRRACSEARAMAAMVIQQAECITLTALSKELGRDLSALSQSANRLRKQMKACESLQMKWKLVKMRLETPKSQA